MDCNAEVHLRLRSGQLGGAAGDGLSRRDRRECARQYRLRGQDREEGRDRCPADARGARSTTHPGRPDRRAAPLTLEPKGKRMSEAAQQSIAKNEAETWGAFINGAFAPAASGKTFPTFNPG